MRQLKISQTITNRDSDAVEKYLQEIAKVPLLNPNEEVDLTKRIKDGDQRALEKIVKANLRFVVSVAKQYQRQGLSLGDLINEGNLGLIKAAHRFDETKGFKFISYAVWRIRQSILQALSENSRIVRLPQNKIGFGNKVDKVASQLEQDFEREPSAEEIAEALNIEIEEVEAAIGVKGRHISLDSPIKEDAESTLLDVYESKDATDNENFIEEDIRKQIVKDLMDTLTDKEKDIINHFFFPEQGLTAGELEAKYNLTKERIRQIKESIIKRRWQSQKDKIKKVLAGTLTDKSLYFHNYKGKRGRGNTSSNNNLINEKPSPTHEAILEIYEIPQETHKLMENVAQEISKYEYMEINQIFHENGTRIAESFHERNNAVFNENFSKGYTQVTLHFLVAPNKHIKNYLLANNLFENAKRSIYNVQKLIFNNQKIRVPLEEAK